MYRVLGEVPHVEKVHWDWDEQVIYVRFREGEVGEAAALKKAVDEGTMFQSGDVTWIQTVAELPDEIR